MDHCCHQKTNSHQKSHAFSRRLQQTGSRYLTPCGDVRGLVARALAPEEVVQLYGFCIRTLRLPVISVMIIGVMRLSYNERAVPGGRFRHHLFQAVFMRTTYPSRCVYFGWSRVHTSLVPRPHPKIGKGAWCHLQTFPYVPSQEKGAVFSIVVIVCIP